MDLRATSCCGGNILDGASGNEQRTRAACADSLTPRHSLICFGNVDSRAVYTIGADEQRTCSVIHAIVRAGHIEEAPPSVVVGKTTTKVGVLPFVRLHTLRVARAIERRGI